MTKQEISELKQNWLKDPCYNLETAVSGKYKKDLHIFRLEHEKKWLQERLDKLENYRQMLREFLGVDKLQDKMEAL